MLQIIYITIVP